MTTSNPWNTEGVYQQLSELHVVVAPLIHRLMQAGSFDAAVTEAKTMGAEVLFSSFQPQGRVADGDGAEMSEAPATGGSGPNLGSVAGMAAHAAPALLYAQLGLQGLRITADFMRDYTQTVEAERTRRHEITAERDVRLSEIASMRSIFEIYLANTFDERRSNFAALFQRLSMAQDQSDLQGMQLVLAGILDLAKSSPFKDLATFKAQLDDPEFVLEL